MKETEINIKVKLDENHIPEQINWVAQDGGIENQESKAMMLAFWDADNKEALRMDLWVKDMPMDDMKRFFHQTIVSMSDTYLRATNEDDVAEQMREFAENFAINSGIKSK